MSTIGRFEKMVIKPLEQYDSFQSDSENGVVRLSAWTLRRLGGRNVFVKITSSMPSGATKSIVRIAKAATRRNNSLTKMEIALQYDDRLLLGIRKSRELCDIKIQPINQIIGFMWLLLSHPLPAIKYNSILAISLAFAGGVLGFLLGKFL